jgi:hypothetical protein
MAGQPRKWLADLGEKIAGIKKIMASGQSANEELIEAGGEADRTVAKFDTWEAFAPGWLKAAAGSVAEIRGLSYALTGLSLVADASDLISPQDHGVMATIDRLAAGANAVALILHQGIERGLAKFRPRTLDGPEEAAPEEALPEEAVPEGGEAASEEAVTEGGAVVPEAAVDAGLVTLNASLDWIPVAGEVAIIGTGVYLAGDFLYHHWTPFCDVAKAVGHAAVKVVDDIGGGIEPLVNDLTD